MKNSLENLVVLLILLSIINPYTVSIIAGIVYKITGGIPLIVGQILSRLSPFFLGGLLCSLFSQDLCPSGGLECIWLMVPAGIAFLAYLISLIFYLISFKRAGKASKKGLAGKIKHFVPWLIYVYSFALIGWLIFCLIANYINLLFAIPVFILLAIIWFFITWKLKKRITP